MKSFYVYCERRCALDVKRRILMFDAKACVTSGTTYLFDTVEMAVSSSLDQLQIEALKGVRWAKER